MRALSDHARSDDTLTAEHRGLLCAPPSWLRQHLREVGAAGGFAPGIPVGTLARLYGDVAEFRSRHPQPDGDDPPDRGLGALLGDRRDDPLGRRQWDLLAARAGHLRQPRSVGRARAR